MRDTFNDGELRELFAKFDVNGERMSCGCGDGVLPRATFLCVCVLQAMAPFRPAKCSKFFTRPGWRQLPQMRH